MALSDRLNQIICEQNISKTEFAHRLGITVNYVYILTGNSRPDTEQNKTISPSLAKLIALELADIQITAVGNIPHQIPVDCLTSRKALLCQADIRRGWD